jgi:hypothetical protein
MLYSGPIEAALASLDLPFDTPSPNLWWPEDRAWIVLTEIDYAWTYVGGTAAHIETLLASDTLEVLPTKLSESPLRQRSLERAAGAGMRAQLTILSGGT